MTAQPHAPPRPTPGPSPMARRMAGEPLLEDILSDPLVHLLMARDGVSGAALRATIANARQRLVQAA